jgi:PleD family two-component response regulator
MTGAVHVVTASAGVAASIPVRGVDPLALLSAADAALYAAKAAGRNRAMSAGCIAALPGTAAAAAA